MTEKPLPFYIGIEDTISDIFVTVKPGPHIDWLLLQNELLEFISHAENAAKDFFAEEEAQSFIGDLGRGQRPVLEHLLKFGKYRNKAFVLHGPYAREFLNLLIGYPHVYLLPDKIPLTVKDKFEKPALRIRCSSEKIEVFPEKESESRILSFGGEKWYLSGRLLARLLPVYSQPLWDTILTRGKTFQDDELFDFIDNFPNYWNRYLDFQWEDRVCRVEIHHNQLHIELRLDYDDGIIKVDPVYHYGKMEFTYNDIIKKGPYIVKSVDEQIYFIRRDPKKERRLFLFFFQYNFKWEDGYFVLKENDDIIDFLINGFRRIPSDWAKKLTPEFRQIRIFNVTIRPVLEISLEEESFFSLNFGCRLKEDYSLSPETLKKHIREGDPFIKLDRTRILKLVNLEEIRQFINEFKEAFSLSLDKKENFRHKIYYLPHLINYVKKNQDIEIRGDDRFKALYEELMDVKGIRKVKVPESLDHILRPYQKEGFYWLHFLHRYKLSGILADDMGLGKTVQALAMISSLKSPLPSLVVCPKSLMHNWVKEVKKFTPELKCVVVEGNRAAREEILSRSSETDLFITSYSLLRNDIDLYGEKVYHYVILDEAQHIKNYQTKVARSVKKLDAMFRLVLTGTPMENSIRELWSIFDFIMPGYLGTRRHFVDHYDKEIVREKNEEVLAELNLKIKPFVLRRTKEEVLTELPPKIEQISVVPLTEGQRELYQRILSEIRSEIFGLVEKEGFIKSRMHILSALIRLRQICNHPGMIYPELAESDDISAKMDLLREILAESIDGGHRILLFSQFVKMLHIIRDDLRKEKIPFEYIDGKTSNRVDIVDRFNENEDIPIILVSLKAGGTGLNITGADVVVHFDPWWNPMVERQATDRAYRMGQTRTVNVYKLMTEGTIEEKIIKMQEEKSEMFHALDFTDTAFMKTMSWEDLKILFE